MSVVLSVPSNEVIREKAREVLSRDDYDLSAFTGREPNRLWEFLGWIWDRLVELTEFLQGLLGPWVWLLYVALTALLVLLVWHIGYTMSRGLRIQERAPRPAQGGRSRDPRELERLAEAALGLNDYVEAVRLLFRAAILRLENAERRTNRPGMTNRELLRRYRPTPLYSALQQFVEVLDTAWYGGHECGQADYELCRQAHNTVRSQARRVIPAAPGSRASPPVLTSTTRGD